ncbi:hypothetical protein [Desulfoplanes sp.]
MCSCTSTWKYEAGEGVPKRPERGYHHAYGQAGREVVLVGMDFSREARNLTGFGFEKG